MRTHLRPRLLIIIAALTGALILAACSSGAATSVDDAADPVSPSDTAPSPTAGLSEPVFEVVPLEKPLEAPSEVPEELKAVWEVWALLTREHVDRADMDPTKFAEAAIKGMLTALDDPHTNYVRPEAFKIDNEDIQGKFEGIGANVSMTRDGKLQIVAPIKGSPAEAAGLKSGDKILEVDGENIVGLSLLGAVAKIRGPAGTVVVLLVEHLGAVDPVEISVTRGVIPLTSVLLRTEPGDEIAHIRLTNFFADTNEILMNTIQEATDSGAKGLIIDVRGNPGGLLSSVVDITSLFLEDGLVLYEIDGAGQRTNWNVRKGGIAKDIPLVVLSDKGSASASEILIGALQDHDRATIIGDTTFGKGSVNVLRRLSNDGGLYITFARWFTPSGRLIQGLGLEPDIEVTAVDARDNEVKPLEKAREVLKSLIAAKNQVNGSSS